MSRFHLDYEVAARGPAALNVLLLAAGILALGLAVGYRQFVISTHLDALRAEARELQIALAPAPVASTMKPAELKIAWDHALSISAQHALPWDRLFANMEKAAAQESLAFLSIEPDPGKGRLQVQAEAKDFPAMIDFVRGLQAAEDFDDVVLQSHQIVDTVPERPVRFRVSAHWKLRR